MSQPHLAAGDHGEPTGLRVEVRCPEQVEFRDKSLHPGKILTVLYLYADPGQGVIELPCEPCKRRMGAAGDRPRLVLHRYSLAGVLVGTLVQRDESG